MNEVEPIDLLRQENKELKSALQRRTASSVMGERILGAIQDALEEVPVPKVFLPRDLPVREEFESPHHVQVCLWSDWHGGEVVFPEQVGGLNEFNFEILERRVDETCKAMLSFQDHRPAVSKLVVGVLGDMVSGNIHEELVSSNQFPIAKQSVKAGYLLGTAISKLAPFYPRIEVVCVSGNHARTKLPHASKNVFDSYDWLAYHLASAYTRNLPNVVWEIPESGMVVKEVAGLNILFLHGDGIRSSMPGVPFGGVMRRYNEWVKSYLQVGIELDGAAYGHFHSSHVIQDRLFGNGSLIGPNEFGSKNYGGGEPPKQLLLNFDSTKSRLTDVSYITPR